mmetsp:Transcript_16713/g.28215  ORF Transcript_16713/g.28215 Transcript_16713/m.28215 type:complete len:228 (+) Transcript_16713:239-922(+)
MLKGMLESSSNKKELLAELFVSSIMSCFMFASTSCETVSVPYLSSQYIVDMRYSCCTLRTGQRSLLISSSVFLDFWWMTKKVTACRMYLSSSQATESESTESAPAMCNQFSSSASPILTYSPLEKEQHSRRNSRLLNSCTLMNENTWVKSLRIRKLLMWFMRRVESKESSEARMVPQCWERGVFVGPWRVPLGVLLVLWLPLAARGAWMHCPSSVVISRLTLSLTMP